MREIKIVEYKGKRVLTTAQSAEFLGTETELITRNFNRNKGHYQIGEDYFALEGKEKTAFLVNLPFKDVGSKHAKTLYIWTFLGCVRHYNGLRAIRFNLLCDLARHMGLEPENFINIAPRRIEHDLTQQVRNLLHGICSCVTQYPVGRYRIDCYIPELNIAVEYDESHHQYQNGSDGFRQSYIEKELQCTFIRVEEGYDFSLIANKIMIALLKSKGRDS